MTTTPKPYKSDRIIHRKLRGDISRNVEFSDELRLGWLEGIQLNDQDIKQYYEETYAKKYYEEEKARIESNFANFLPLQTRRVNYIKQYIDPADSLLEIGCGPGYFLQAVSPLCQHVKGLEMNAHEVQFAKEKKGLDVDSGFVESLRGQTFQHICLFQVLEHQPDPVAFLKTLRTVVDPSRCYLHVELPTLHNPLVSLYEVPAFRDFWFQEPHLFYFTKESLKHIADSANLQVVSQFLDQESTLINHLNWMLTGKPMKHRKYVVSPTPPTELVNDIIEYNKDEYSAKLNAFFVDMQNRYKELMGELGFGDVLFSTLTFK